VISFLARTVLLTILLFTFVFPQRTSTNVFSDIEISGEYFTPTKDNRQIETVSLNMLYGWERNRRIPYVFKVGVTLSYAWGEITQLNENLIVVTTPNDAFAAGPVFLTGIRLPITKRLSVLPYFSGGALLYSEDFPFGGDIYNFMWRMGGSFDWQLNKNDRLITSFLWMHVSNGQGLNPGNPSYEGVGIRVGFSRELDL